MLDIMEIPRIGYLGTLGQSIVGKPIGSWGRPPIHSYSGSQGFTEAFHHHLLPYSAFHYLNWGGGRSVGSIQRIGGLHRKIRGRIRDQKAVSTEFLSDPGIPGVRSMGPSVSK